MVESLKEELCSQRSGVTSEMMQRWLDTMWHAGVACTAVLECPHFSHDDCCLVQLVERHVRIGHWTHKRGVGVLQTYSYSMLPGAVTSSATTCKELTTSFKQVRLLLQLNCQLQPLCGCATC